MKYFQICRAELTKQFLLQTAKSEKICNKENLLLSSYRLKSEQDKFIQFRLIKGRLSVSALHVLDELGIEDVDNFLQVSDEKLYRVRSYGIEAIKEILREQDHLRNYKNKIDYGYEDRRSAIVVLLCAILLSLLPIILKDQEDISGYYIIGLFVVGTVSVYVWVYGHVFKIKIKIFEIKKKIEIAKGNNL
jgi:hypothetical protein